MSKKKGLSASEKKSKMLEIFHETQNVFQLKDLEKIAPKSKGIIVQSVKGVLQELVDDGLVETAKIGSCVYFWSFAGKTLKEIKRKIEDTEKKIKTSNTKLEALDELVGFEESKNDDVAKIEEIQKEIESLKKRKTYLELEVNISKGLDPETVHRKIQQSKIVFEAANRWTDNVFTVKTWCKHKFGMLDKDLDKNFGIAEDFDYLDEKMIK